MTGTTRADGDLAWCTPKRVPSEVTSLEGSVSGGLAVGAPGKVGVLDLTLASTDAVTRIERQYQRSPLHIFRPIYLDQVRPGMAFIFLQQSGDGLVQGDRCRIDIALTEGSEAHFATQSATTAFPCHGNYASQLVNLWADANAVLEYLPDPVIPFRGSRLVQKMRVVAHRHSTVILGEIVLPGRVAFGESHQYDVFWSELDVLDQDGHLLFSDLLRLLPGETSPHSPVLFGAHDVVASLYVITDRVGPDHVAETLRATTSELPEVLAGVSELPNGCGAGLRVLARTSMSAKAAVRSAWAAAHEELLGTPVPDLRKG
jgi:urease accessory protein